MTLVLKTIFAIVLVAEVLAHLVPNAATLFIAIAGALFGVLLFFADLQDGFWVALRGRALVVMAAGTLIYVRSEMILGGMWPH